MHDKTLHILTHWLHETGYRPDREYLKQRFLSHPDAGTLSSITDTLNDLQIEHAAVKISPDQWKDLSVPFLAFIELENEEQFVMATVRTAETVEVYTGDAKPLIMPESAFKALFTGILVAVDPNDSPVRFSPAGYLQAAGLLLLLICPGIVFFLNGPRLFPTAYFLLSAAGLAASGLLLAKSNGEQHSWLDRFCNLSARTSCNAVLHSKAASITSFLSLTDAGIIYFAAQFVSLSLLPGTSPLWVAVSIPAMLFSFYSIYQQAFVIKKWCPLCLAVISVLALQGIISCFHLPTLLPDVRSIMSCLLMLVLVYTGWLLLKPLWEGRGQLQQANLGLLAFKRNYHLLLAYHEQQMPTDDQLLRQAPDVVIGNRKAAVTLTMITNPLCQACQSAHRMLQQFLQSYPEEICLQIVFYVPYQQPKDPRTMIAAWLYDSYIEDSEKGSELIARWYDKPDISAFNRLKEQETVADRQQKNLGIHHDWCLQQKLTLTPLILINGKLFPLFYATEDLEYHIAELVAAEMNRQEVNSYLKEVFNIGVS